MKWLFLFYFSEAKAKAAQRLKQSVLTTKPAVNPAIESFNDKANAQNKFDSLGFVANNNSRGEDMEKKLKQENEMKIKEQDEKTKHRPQDKSRPISSTPIVGTPW